MTRAMSLPTHVRWPNLALTLTLTFALIYHHDTITAPSLHHPCTITAPSLHHHCTITAPSLLPGSTMGRSIYFPRQAWPLAPAGTCPRSTHALRRFQPRNCHSILVRDPNPAHHRTITAQSPTAPSPHSDPASNYISGHAFSRDGLANWTVSPVEPFSFTVKYDDGTTGLLSTRERPKLLFDQTTGEPTHHGTVIAPSLHRRCTIAAPPLHHHCTR